MTAPAPLFWHPLRDDAKPIRCCPGCLNAERECRCPQPVSKAARR